MSIAITPIIGRHAGSVGAYPTISQRVPHTKRWVWMPKYVKLSTLRTSGMERI